MQPKNPHVRLGRWIMTLQEKGMGVIQVSGCLHFNVDSFSRLTNLPETLTTSMRTSNSHEAEARD